MVPGMYLISQSLRRPMRKFYGTKWIALLGFLGPFFFIFVGIMFLVRRIQGKPVWMGRMKRVSPPEERSEIKNDLFKAASGRFFFQKNFLIHAAAQDKRLSILK